MGSNLCLALKKKIKRSPNCASMTTENQTGGVALHLVCARERIGLSNYRCHSIAALLVLTIFYASDQEYYESRKS